MGSVARQSAVNKLVNILRDLAVDAANLDIDVKIETNEYGLAQGQYTQDDIEGLLYFLADMIE